MQHKVLVPVSHPLGGIRTYMLYSFRRLHEEGVRFTFLSEAGAAFESFKRDLAEWEETRFIDIPEGGGSLAAIQAIRRALRRNDFTLIHSQGLRSGTEAAAADYFRRLPHFITLHDVIVPENDIPGRFKALKKAIISATTRRATTIIPVSRDCAENHLKIFPAWRRGPVTVETILNGIDIDRIDRSRKHFQECCRQEGGPRLRRELDIPDGAVLAGFFGRFMPQKGFDILLDALARLARNGLSDRLRIVATKDPNGFLHETMAAATKDPEVDRMVRFIDARPDIVPLLMQCDLCVIPSRWEACPILPMEALVLGVPVVGTNCIGLREVLRGTPSLIADMKSMLPEEALAEKLADFIESPTTEAAQRYAENARERFDVRHTTDELLSLYTRDG